jgi:hypothetical protein
MMPPAAPPPAAPPPAARPPAAPLPHAPSGGEAPPPQRLFYWPAYEMVEEGF